MDKAGWHVVNDLNVSANISLVSLPVYSPEFNSIKRLWQVVRATLLSHRLFTHLDHIIEV
jgi:transposase